MLYLCLNQIEIALSFSKCVEVIDSRSRDSLYLDITINIGVTRHAINIVSGVVDIAILSRSFLEKTTNEIYSLLPVLRACFEVKRILIKNILLLL